MARRMSADVLLLECPTWFDGVQIRGVGRHVDEMNASVSTCSGDTRVVVGGEVVHYEHVVALELREKDGLEPSDESVLVGGREHGRERHPARQPDCPKDGQVFAPIHGDSFDKLVAAPDPGMRPAHCEVHARFVEENELIGRHSSNATQELSTLHFDVGPQTLQRPAAFFFTTYP